jgi:hypothetical protein
MFIIMGVSTVIFTMMAFKAVHEKRTFFFAACYITAVSSFAYYAMLSGQAWLITPNCRQLFYVRYLEWAATTPLILLVLSQTPILFSYLETIWLCTLLMILCASRQDALEGISHLVSCAFDWRTQALGSVAGADGTYILAVMGGDGEAFFESLPISHHHVRQWWSRMTD